MVYNGGMKTVLIVDDESSARAAVKSLVKKSGVPVEVIMECGNGELALEILKEQEVDVMFTDVCMPVMDGIELAQKMTELTSPPRTVAVSGHDDFFYAVELMRCGVRDYLLKPVAQNAVTAVMKRFEEELLQSSSSHKSEQQMGYQQLKYLVLNQDISEQEMQTLREKASGDVLGEPYFVCLRRHNVFRLFTTDYIYLDNVAGDDLFLVPVGSLPLLLKNELAYDYVGISGECTGLDALKAAYAKARENRRIAFLSDTPAVRGEAEVHVPEKLREEAKKLLSDEEALRRIQLIGTDRTGELKAVWERFFTAAAKLRISAEEFETAMTAALQEIGRTYRNALPEGEELSSLMQVFSYPNLTEYKTKFGAFLLRLSEQIGEQYDTNKSRQKMQAAVDYIRENYAKELNMAVVSNYISMNYSLFSYSFKQYTGSNFVNFLKNIRMEEAKRLLKDTDLKVSAISRRVGYDNEKHFMKTFKMSCGVSPSEYRKNEGGAI